MIRIELTPVGSLGFEVSVADNTAFARRRVLEVDTLVTGLHPEGDLTGMALVRWIPRRALARRLAIVVVSA